MHKDALGRRWQKWLNLPDVGEMTPPGKKGAGKVQIATEGHIHTPILSCFEMEAIFFLLCA